MITLYPTYGPRVRTTHGHRIGPRPRLSPEACRAVRRQLERGPFLAAIDAGIDRMQDIYRRDDGDVRLVTVEGD